MDPEVREGKAKPGDLLWPLGSGHLGEGEEDNTEEKCHCFILRL